MFDIPGVHQYNVGRDSSVSIATRYGLDGPGIESWWRRDFPQPSRPTLGPVSYTMGINGPGCGVNHPPLSSAGVK